MYGNLTGNIIAILFYIYFQLAGVACITLCFRKEKLLNRLLLGSVTGSLTLTWLPILFAFLFDFTILSHILALLVTLPVWVAVYRTRRRVKNQEITKNTAPESIKEHTLFLSVLTVFLLFWCYLLHTHTIPVNTYVGMDAGQCTYGDMNMHLGFITSLAVQQSFPPEYSIMPGVKLSYPFLSDSISSGLYLFGASLRTAYILPMIFAMAQIFTTVYLFAETLFKSLRKSMLVLTLFFLNGGLGFFYFIDWASKRTYQFKDIFTGFYTTPTNLVDQNIRWVNLIADMFLPQRATLFGYAVLFPALWLLYQAVFENRKEYFLPAGLFASALPMIHTHSFLSAGIISAVWLLLWLLDKVHPATLAPRKNILSGKLAPGILFGFLLIMCILQTKNKTGSLNAKILVFLGIAILVAAVIYGVTLLFRSIRAHGLKEILSTWGLYLLCVLLLAIPQLLYWTFGQVAQGSFVRGHFNWGNLGDQYIWFYIKNIGAPLLLIFGSICACNRKKAPLLLPVLFLWWLGELIVFTPNTYDNNKLLYVAYLLLCFAAADYGVDVYDKLKDIPGRKLFAGVFLFTAVFSGVLTLGREAVSNYQLYSPAQVALAEYIEANTECDAVFLSNTRHNNEIPSLTGRSIVCGADTFLYFHGIDTSARKVELQLMYEAPLENLALYEKYDVSYVVISSFEKNSYHIDETVFKQHFKEVFSYGDVHLYQIP